MGKSFLKIFEENLGILSFGLIVAISFQFLTDISLSSRERFVYTFFTGLCLTILYSFYEWGKSESFKIKISLIILGIIAVLLILIWIP